ncbi:hypothetical protein SV7mr_21270 [Stieleria bergensis]|uniref:Uncharacterized protein n=1 Tax=Stieleria bergensis TaxID=2528025 RepID=A0A517SU12_9BACT|nr:hypothetical protein SV7mr_21270 [Planctomycetes bacterium SV_7m_r]
MLMLVTIVIVMVAVIVIVVMIAEQMKMCASQMPVRHHDASPRV